MSLQKKTISGLIWTFSQQFSVQIINFVVSIILARLLVPEEFGLIAMITIFIGIGNVLIDNGLASSLIRTETIDQRDLSTVFWVNVGASLVIYWVIFFCAPLIADFYRQPVLVPLIRTYTISFVINALSVVQSTLLSKEMNFRKQMLIQLPNVIICGITGIFLAYRGFGVWTFVYMNILNSVLTFAFHWVRSSWYPKFVFHRSSFGKHFKFGYKLTLSGILDQVFENLYVMVIGRFFSAGRLALYNRAYTLQMLPVQNISSALTKVTFPLFAKIQNDDEKLRIAYKKILVLVFSFTVPIMLSMQLSARPLVLLLFTDKWLGAVPYFQILCFYGLLYPLHVYNLNVLLVKGRSDQFFRLEVVKKVVFVLGIPVVFFYGVQGLAWWLLAHSIFCFFVNAHYSGRYIHYSVWAQFKSLTPILLMGMAIWTAIKFLLVPLIGTQNNFLQILILGCSFLLLYILLSLLFKLQAAADVKKLIQRKSLLE